MHYLFFSNQVWQEATEFSHRLLPFLQQKCETAFSLHHSSNRTQGICSLNRFPEDTCRETVLKRSPYPCPEASGKASPLTIAAVGAGGKTTLLMQLMQECIQQGLQVMVTTTTHMFLPEAERLPSLRKEGMPQNQHSPIPVSKRNPVFLGTPAAPPVRQEGWIKCGPPDPELFWTLYPKMDVVLIEADGSKRLPAKVPAPWEPVIPDCTDLILAVYGLSSLGQPLGKCCHRWELLEGASPSSDFHQTFSCEEELSSQPITPKLLGSLMKKYYLDPLGKKYGYPSVIPVWNQADTQTLSEAAKIAAACCGHSSQIITTIF